MIAFHEKKCYITLERYSVLKLHRMISVVTQGKEVMT